MFAIITIPSFSLVYAVESTKVSKYTTNSRVAVKAIQLQGELKNNLFNINSEFLPLFAYLLSCSE